MTHGLMEAADRLQPIFFFFFFSLKKIFIFYFSFNSYKDRDKRFDLGFLNL
jgi:hypothetical protein